MTRTQSAALAPLRLGAFRRLALARFVDELGDWLGEIALAVLVFDRTGSPMATAGLFLALQFAPALLAPPLVARLEELDYRVSLTGLNAALAVVFVGLGFLSGGFSMAAVIPLAVLAGGLIVAARALSRAAAAVMLSPAGLLREGNALLNIGFTAGAALGPAIGGVVVAAAGVRTGLLADAVSFTAVGLMLATASGLPGGTPREGSPGRSLRLGFQYVRERPLLRRLIAAQSAAFVFFATVIPIEVVFVKETLHAGDAGYGALLASWGGGMLVGSIAFAGLRRLSLRMLLPISTLAVGAAYLAIAAAPSLLVACVASAIGGAGNGIQWVGLMTAVQQLTAREFQAKVISFLEALAKAAPGLGFLLGGALATVFNARVSYAVAGVGVIAVLVVAGLAISRSDWSRRSVPETNRP